MSDLSIRKDRNAGRITLTRPQALNALSQAMSIAIQKALDGWAEDPEVKLVILDAEGDRAFCAGGDLALIYHDAKDNRGEETIAFWQQEYELNATIAAWPKPVVAFMQGFVMGGGVGLGGHASERIVCETTQVAMPECGIGLIPDVGGSFILSRGPGALGEYLGVTGARMGATDAIHAGFANRFVPQAEWPRLIETLAATGSTACLEVETHNAPEGQLAAQADLIDRVFSAPDMEGVAARLETETGELAESARKAIARNSPLSMHTTLALVRRVRGLDSLRQAIGLEFRAAARALLEGDFVEGIRAQIIDKDRTPHWKHASLDAVTPGEVARMLRPFDKSSLEFEEIPE